MLLCDELEWVDKARKWSTQSRVSHLEAHAYAADMP